MMRVLVGGVGYRNLRDHSFAIALLDRLGAHHWPAGVAVEDISYNPIAVVQRLEDEPPDRRFDLAIVAGVLQRDGRRPGTMIVYRWDGALPPPAAIHDAITEAVTGIISLDNTLVIGRQFAALPPTVVVVEVEPDAHEFGAELTPAVSRALDDAELIVGRLVREPRTAADLPVGSLPSGRAPHTGVVFASVAHDTAAN
jgi:hydrogenase maturation protease